MYTAEEISQRSKENVKDAGEVFTPFAIVDQMVALIPDEAWADPKFCFLEPTCGNGQILVKIFERRIAAGIGIEDALNTLIGMDISKENINEASFRLFERAANQMRVEGAKQGSKEWYRRAFNIVAIVANNIFLMKDSIAYITSGALTKKKFFFTDPTGNEQIATDKVKIKIAELIKKEFRKGKGSKVLSPYFKKEAVAT